MAGGVVGELQACRSGEGHKLSLYLGHWDATAAACRQDAIMQEEGKSWAPGGQIVTGRDLFTVRDICQEACVMI